MERWHVFGHRACGCATPWHSPAQRRPFCGAPWTQVAMASEDARSQFPAAAPRLSWTFWQLARKWAAHRPATRCAV